MDKAIDYYEFLVRFGLEHQVPGKWIFQVPRFDLRMQKNAIQNRMLEVDFLCIFAEGRASHSDCYRSSGGMHTLLHSERGSVNVNVAGEALEDTASSI